MFKIFAYSERYKQQWNKFIEVAKNSTFLFNRDYMDYHSDRFVDASLVIYRNDRLYALLPANRLDDVIYSHQGLTYGGLIIDSKATAAEVILLFTEINNHYRSLGVNKIVYKPTPHIYHTIPAEEDLYGLFRMNARLIARNLSCTIYQNEKLRFIESRRSGIRKAKKENLYVQQSMDWDVFWTILSNNLGNKYGVKPVHSLSEIKMLSARFPENIKLWLTYKDNKAYAGTVIYLSGNVCHTQYISATPLGKECGALDLLFDKLINDEYSSYPIFDFGHSTEEGGRLLNENLIFQKEGFGGRGICYDTYEYDI